MCPGLSSNVSKITLLTRNFNKTNWLSVSQEQRDEIYIFQEMVGLGIMSAYPFGPSALADGSNGVSWNHIYTLDMLGHSNKCTETESQKIPGILRGIIYYQIRG